MDAMTTLAPGMVSQASLAQELGISVSLVKIWRNEGMPAMKVGGGERPRWAYDAEECRAWADRKGKRAHKPGRATKALGSLSEQRLTSGTQTSGAQTTHDTKDTRTVRHCPSYAMGKRAGMRNRRIGMERPTAAAFDDAEYAAGYLDGWDRG